MGDVVLDQSFLGWGCRLGSVSPVVVGGRQTPSPARFCKAVVRALQWYGKGRGWERAGADILKVDLFARSKLSF